ncbi:hypothetical protein GCM10008939_06570 [Deinococcus aquiradiocola]|uniref:Uncharacterized protein n=1 Tax=Deinococcus aquiradiocola TaxID=393059 RepID=A0A917P7D9_9DEIO|nr:hypothetical protein GCM10008939_06570 [Deinococcus aquiradiocola]
MQDPAKVQGAFSATLRQQPDALALRIIRVYPDDTLPGVGASIDWLGYPLIVVAMSDPSDFTGTRVLTGRLER